MQIIGTLKCRNTRKCRLWFDQRGISYHFVDLDKRALSPGELNAIAQNRKWDSLMDTEGKEWKTRQLEWKNFDPKEELLECPKLLKTPILREGREVIIGYNETEWNRIAKYIKDRP